MHLSATFFIFAGVFINTWTMAQETSRIFQRTNIYTAPVDIPMFLSGNYGEIRATHFHSGIDIKTEQVEGKNVLAAEGGYVNRIVVQSGGYGKALYLQHENGQTTVYGHLKQFTPAIENYVRDIQYNRKSYEVDIYPEKDLFTFYPGALLGLSGNTGRSGGPHLHFEIRDRASVPLNVLQYDFDIQDNISPKINWLAVYPLDEQSTVNGMHATLLVPVSGKDGSFFLTDPRIRVSGKIGFGIETFDYLDYSANACSPNTLSLSVDNRQLYICRIDSIPFAHMGYVNSHIDYAEKMGSGKVIQKLFVDPNNRLGIYKVALNRGVLSCTDTAMHAADIVVRDTYGNTSILSFQFRGAGRPATVAVPKEDPAAVARFRYDSQNVFENQDIRVVLPEDALFDHLDFRYSATKNDSFPWSAIHHVHHAATPLFKSYVLSVRAQALPEQWQEKAILVSRDKKGEWISHGGSFKHDFVTARVRSFGSFFIAIDSLKPEIVPVSFTPGARYDERQVLAFTIRDKLSGIRKYMGYIDKKWALFEYDAKNDLLFYYPDAQRLEKNRTHQLEIIVTDNVDNVAHFRGEFRY